MEISKQSWHYRWMRKLSFQHKWEWRDPVSLCSYFWTIVWYNFRIILLLSIICLFIYKSIVDSQFRLALFLILGGVVVVIISIFILIILKDYLENRAYERVEPSLITKYFHAILDKVCPIIDYKE